MLSNDGKKIKTLINQFYLKQVTHDPTHYTESSSSLIDLILCRNPTNVLCSGVIDPFIPNQIRYHCPILVLLKFLCPKLKLTKRKIWYYERSDFIKYRDLLSGSDLINKINLDSNIDSNVSIINEAVLEAARKSVPNKVVTIRPNAHPWIDCNIRRIIRKRKRAYRKYKQTSNDYYSSL